MPKPPPAKIVAFTEPLGFQIGEDNVRHVFNRAIHDRQDEPALIVEGSPA
jgi:hypothetical protein